LPAIQARPSLSQARGFGSAQDYLNMSVNVAVRKLGDVADPSDA
jgi:hypothetical protein